MMMKYALLIIGISLLCSCSDSFINHDLEFEKTGDCSGYNGSVKMISNINGERYEFFCCMDDGFNGKDYQVLRTGDSILVSFPKTLAQKQVLYKLKLDIDAKPRYSLIMIDDRKINMVPAEK